MSKTLFDTFQPLSAKHWKQYIQAELKGADYNQSLIWNSLEGINVKPFYHADDLSKHPPQPVDTQAKPWQISETIYVHDVKKSNTKAKQLLKQGVDHITFILPKEDISINNLIQNINLDDIKISFHPQFLSSNFISEITDVIPAKNYYLFTDIIGNLAKSGNWFYNLEDDHIQLEKIVTISKSISIDIGLYQNAGANIIQQLAYGLAHFNEYLNYFETLSAKQQSQPKNIIFKITVGSNYFFEIAKIRALRNLFTLLIAEYNLVADCTIFATPTTRNKTIYDYNTNMLRTTTECMSAILGGADIINNLAYDTVYHKTNAFAERISRNQLLILKHESYFNKVNNPSDGAYYIETLTQQLSEEALQLFKDIEAQGGFLKHLKSGIIQKKIKESANKEQIAFNNGNITLLGINKHPNTADRMSNTIERYPFTKKNIRKTLIEPIIETRLAENLEQERLKTETNT